MRPALQTLVMPAVSVVVLAGLVGAGAGPALASTITNGDTVTYTLSIEEKSERKSETLPPGEQLTEICSSRCVVKLEGVEDSEWRLEGDERVTIEGGLMYYDGQVGGPDVNRPLQDETPFQ